MAPTYGLSVMLRGQGPFEIGEETREMFASAHCAAAQFLTYYIIFAGGKRARMYFGILGTSQRRVRRRDSRSWPW